VLNGEDEGTLTHRHSGGPTNDQQENTWLNLKQGKRELRGLETNRLCRMRCSRQKEERLKEIVIVVQETKTSGNGPGSLIFLKGKPREPGNGVGE